MDIAVFLVCSLVQDTFRVGIEEPVPGQSRLVLVPDQSRRKKRAAKTACRSAALEGKGYGLETQRPG
jgi:hypothetical protein